MTAGCPQSAFVIQQMDTSSVCTTDGMDGICNPLRRVSDSSSHSLDCCEAQDLPDLPDLAQCPGVSSRPSREDCSRLQLQELADFVQLAGPLPVANLRSLSSTDETLVHRQLRLSEPGTYMGMASPRQLDSVQEAFGVSRGVTSDALLSAEQLEESSVSSNALGCRGLAAVLGEVAGAFPAVVGASQSVGFSTQQQLPEPASTQPVGHPVLPPGTHCAAAGQPLPCVPATAPAQTPKQPAILSPLQHVQQQAGEQQGVLPAVQDLLRQHTSNNVSSVGSSATSTPRASSKGNNTAHLVSPGLQARIRAAELAAAGRTDPISWAAAEAEAIQADTKAAAAAARQAQQQHIEQELQKRKAEAARVAVQLAQAKGHFYTWGVASAGCEVPAVAQPHQQQDAGQESLTQLLNLHRKSVPGRLIMTDYSSSSSVSTDTRRFSCASVTETQQMALDAAPAATAAAAAGTEGTNAVETDSAAVGTGASPKSATSLAPSEPLVQDMSLVTSSSVCVGHSVRAAGRALKAGLSGAAAAMAEGKRPPASSLMRQQQQQKERPDDSPQSGSGSPNAAAASKSCTAPAIISNSSESTLSDSPTLRLRVATRLPDVQPKHSPRSPAARAAGLAESSDLSPQQSPKSPASGTSCVSGGLSAQGSHSSAATRLLNGARARVLSPQQSPKSPATKTPGASPGKPAASTARPAWNSTTRVEPSRSSSSSPKAGSSPRASGSPVSRSGSLTAAVRSPLTSPPLSPSTSRLSSGIALPSRIPRLASSSSNNSDPAASTRSAGHQPQLERQLQAPQRVPVQGQPLQRLEAQRALQLQLPHQHYNSAPATDTAASPAAVQAAALPASAGAANSGTENAETAAQHMADTTATRSAAAASEAEIGKIGSAATGSPLLRVDDVQRFNVLDFTGATSDVAEGFSVDGSCGGHFPQAGLYHVADAQEFCMVSSSGSINSSSSNVSEQSLDRSLASELQQAQVSGSPVAAECSERQAADCGADVPHQWPSAEPLELGEAGSSPKFVGQAGPQSHQLLTSSFGIDTTADAVLGPGPTSHMLMSTTFGLDTGASCFLAGQMAGTDAHGAVDGSASTAARTTSSQLDDSMQDAKPQSYKLLTGTFSTDGMTSSLLNGAAAGPAGFYDNTSAEYVDSTSAIDEGVAASEANSALQSGPAPTEVVLERTAAMLQHHYLRNHGDGDCLLMPPDLVVDRLSPRSSSPGCTAAAALSRNTSAANSPNSSTTGSPRGCHSPVTHRRSSSVGGAGQGHQHRPRGSGTDSIGGSANDRSGSMGGSPLRNVSRHNGAVGFGQTVSPSPLALEAAAAAAVPDAGAAPPGASSVIQPGSGLAAGLSHSAETTSAGAAAADASAAAAGGASDAGDTASDAGADAADAGVDAVDAVGITKAPVTSSTAVEFHEQQHTGSASYQAALTQQHLEQQQQSHQLAAEAPSAAAAAAAAAKPEARSAVSDADTSATDAVTTSSTAATVLDPQHTVDPSLGAVLAQQHTAQQQSQQLTERVSDAAALESDTSFADPGASRTELQLQEEQQADSARVSAALVEQHTQQQSWHKTAGAPDVQESSAPGISSDHSNADLLLSSVLPDAAPQKLFRRRSSTQALGSQHAQPEDAAPLSEQPSSSPPHSMTASSFSCSPRQTADTVQATTAAQSTPATSSDRSNEHADTYSHGSDSAESMAVAQELLQQMASAAIDAQQQQQQHGPAASMDHPEQQQQQQRHRGSADSVSGHLKLQQLIPQKPKPRQQQLPARILTWDGDATPATAAAAAADELADQPVPTAAQSAAADAVLPAATTAAAAPAASINDSSIQRSSSGSPPAPVSTAISNDRITSSHCVATASSLPVAIGRSGSSQHSSSIPRPSSGGSSAGDLAKPADRFLDGPAMAALIADDKLITSSFKRALLESICSREDGTGEQQQHLEEEGGRHACSSSNEPTWQPQQQQISNVVAFCFPRTSSVPAFGNRHSLAPSISGHSYDSPCTSSSPQQQQQQQQRRPEQVLRESDPYCPTGSHDAATTCANLTGGSYYRQWSAGKSSSDTDHPAAAAAGGCGSVGGSAAGGGAGDAILSAAPMLRLSKSSSNLQSNASLSPYQRATDLSAGVSQSGTAAVTSTDCIRRSREDLRFPSCTPISEGTSLSEATNVSVTTDPTACSDSLGGRLSDALQQQHHQDEGSTSAAAVSDAVGLDVASAPAEGRVRGKNSAAAALLSLGTGAAASHHAASLDLSVQDDHHHHQQQQQQTQEQKERVQEAHLARSNSLRLDTTMGGSPGVDQPVVDHQQQQQDEEQQRQQQEEQQQTPRRRNRVSWADTEDAPCDRSSSTSKSGSHATTDLASADMGGLDAAAETPNTLIKSLPAQAACSGTTPSAAAVTPPAAAAAVVTTSSVVSPAAATYCGLPPACPNRSSFRNKNGLIRPSKSCMEFSSLVSPALAAAGGAVPNQQQQQPERSWSSPGATAAAGSSGCGSSRQQQQQVNVFAEAYAVKGALPGALPAAAAAAAASAVLDGSSMQECSAPASDRTSGSATAVSAGDSADHQQQHELQHGAPEPFLSQASQAISVPARQSSKAELSGNNSQSAPADISLLSCSWHEIEPLLDQDDDQHPPPWQSSHAASYNSFRKDSECTNSSSSNSRARSSSFTDGCSTSRQQQQQQQQQNETVEMPDAAVDAGGVASPHQQQARTSQQQPCASAVQQQAAAAAAAAVAAAVPQQTRPLHLSVARFPVHQQQQQPKQQQPNADVVQQQVAAAAAAAVAAATQQGTKPLDPSTARPPTHGQQPLRPKRQQPNAEVVQQQVAAAAAAAVAAAIQQKTRGPNTSIARIPEQQQPRPQQQQQRPDAVVVQQQVAAAAAAATQQETRPLTPSTARVPSQRQQGPNQQQSHADSVQQQVAAAAAAAVAAVVQKQTRPPNHSTALLPQQQQQGPSQDQPSVDTVQQQVAAAAGAAVAAGIQQETRPLNPRTPRLPQQQQQRPDAQRRISWFGFPWQHAQEVPIDLQQQQQMQQQQPQQPMVIDTLDLSDVMLMGQMNMHDSALALQTAVHRLESQTGGGTAT